MRVTFTPDGAMAGTNFRIERLRAQTAPPPAPAPIRPERQISAPEPEVAEEEENEVETADTNEGGTAEEKADRKRRRRRRGKRREDRPAQEASETVEGEAPAEIPGTGEQPGLDAPSEIDLVLEAALGAPADEAEPVLTEPPAEDEAAPKRRRPRTRRRRGDTAEGEAPTEARAEAPQAAPIPVYTDIADIFEAAERAEEAARAARRAAPVAVAPAVIAEEPALELAVEAPAEDATVPAVDNAPAKAKPAVQPIVIGEGDASGEKKRGWWRR